MKANSLARDEAANINVGPILNIALAVVGAVVILSILAALAPQFFTAVGDTVSALLAANTNDSTADTVLGVMATVVAIVLALGFIGLLFAVTKFGVKGGKY